MSHAPAHCYVELLGSARLHTGLKELSIAIAAPTTVPGFLHELARACPLLVGPVLHVEGGALVEGHALNRNGRDFLKSTDVIQPGDRLLLLSSAAGG